jgi:signal transduction histidine kinase
VRAFGEMVALLVAAGNPRAALALEALWNELQQTHAFTLVCAYPLASLDGAAHTELLGAVCAAHGHVIPAESYTTLPTVGARLRAIAALQQQARSLQAALAAQTAARAAAEEALRVRDEFLAIAAHELRTPLTALSGQMQLLRRRLQRGGTLEPAQLAQALELMQGQSERLARLMGHLLDHTRLEAGKLALVQQGTDVVALVQQVVATARTWSAAHPISIVAPPSLDASVDALRLEQVLTNLLDNAVKYSPAGGPIEVVVARSGAETVEVAVRDRGLGIPVEKRAALFERFYQAHRADHRGGLGLGLYVSRQIVELHGGTIAAEFPAEGGTRFVVRLPLGLDTPAVRVTPSAASAASVAR